ncbi:MAG: VWA domain-containing protein [Rhodocyclaceae bacterium]|nr:VWA domain-containing protein [Rhodocyclaceae bacterium]MBX3670211.1 VWA domain-containing protein [Rhodocyclaceae bacterium]
MKPLHRWRLVLGKYAGRHLAPQGLQGQAGRMDQALDYLYGREYRGRGLRDDGGTDAERGPGSLDASQLTLVTWLGEVRELFPRDTVEVIEKHALERYGLTGLLTDPHTLERLAPNQELLRSLLMLKNSLHGEVLQVARRIIRQVVEEIRRKLEAEVRRTLAGRLNRLRHSPLAVAQNFDPLGTLRKNLKHYDRERRRLVVEQIKFFERNTRRLPWDIILCIDQSGSMADSVIHSAVMAGILAALPAFRVKIVVFDTSIVDLSEYADDPVEMLMRVQLGGGTHIARAVRYCAQQVENPQRTVLVLVTDFCEGAPPGELVRAVRELAEARVKLLGLAALDSQAFPVYDRQMAERLAACGMEVAALTPQKLAHWLVKVIS